MQERYAVNLYQVRGPGAVTAHNWVGQLTPLHATSSGKILLAYMPAKERAALLAETGLKKVTPRTITAKTKLEKNLAEARERGYAWALEELELGLHAMAAPVRDRDGEVIAALSASGPAYRFSEERLHELAPVLVKGAEEISHRMGYLGWSPSRAWTQSWSSPMWCSLGTRTPPLAYSRELIPGCVRSHASKSCRLT